MKVITEFEKMQICELVDDLIGHGFHGAISRQNGHNNFYKWNEMHREYLSHIGCVACCGVTRVVIISDQLDWVIKVNFISDNTTPDYNELERDHFQSAINAGLDQYFAAMYYVENIDGIEVYAQEKVRADEDSVSSSFFEYTLENYYNKVNYEQEGVTEDEVNDAAWEESIGLENEDRIYAMITDGMAREVVDFIFENDINDLHSGNWGYRGDEPVLIDYAGY